MLVITSWYTALQGIVAMQTNNTNNKNTSHKVNTDKAPKPVGLYPHARQVGNLLFLSGVGPRQAGTSQIPGVELDNHGNIISYDIKTQCRSVFNNVRTILEASGASWMDLVDVTVFLTNMDNDFAAYNGSVR